MRLFPFLFSVSIVTVFVFSASSFQPESLDETMPLEQIQPGMHGYGYSVFSGTKPKRFEFVVDGIAFEVPNLPVAISVQLYGGPVGSEGKPFFLDNRVHDGMSGSPMYIGDKLIGGLAEFPNFTTTNRVLVTPIKYQFSADVLEHRRSLTIPVVRPGDFVGVCPVYGDSHSCLYSTVTANRGGRLYITSHSGRLQRTSKARLPVFTVLVADLTKTQSRDSKLPGRLEKPVGTASICGAFGFVVLEGDLPATVGVHLRAELAPQMTWVRNYRMAYHEESPIFLDGVLKKDLLYMPSYTKDGELEILINLKQPSGTIRLRDRTSASLESLKRILTDLFLQVGDDLNIGDIELNYRPILRKDVWHPSSITLEGKGRGGSVSVIAKCEDDNVIAEFAVPVDLTALESVEKGDLQWYDGRMLANIVLNQIPILSAFDLLDKLKDRERLYLAVIQGPEDIQPEYLDTEGVWHPRSPNLRVLLKLPSNNRFTMSSYMSYVSK